MIIQSAPTAPTEMGKRSAGKRFKATGKGRKCTALILLQWHEEDAGVVSKPGAPTTEPGPKPTNCQCHNSTPTPVEAQGKSRADWRVP